MQIRVVDKNSRDLESGRLLNLPELLLQSNRKSPEAQSLLAQIQEARQELRCHCQNPSARMFVRYSHENYTLVNHPSEGAHAENCKLYTEIHGYSDRAEPKPANDEDRDLDNFHVHRTINESPTERTTSKPKSTQQSKSSKKNHVLDKLFRHLASETFSNWYYKNKMQYLSSMKVLASFREQCDQIKFGDTTLKQWVYYGNNGFDYATQSVLKAIKNKTWNGKGRPHALWLTLTDNVQIAKGHVIIDGVAYPYSRIIRPYAPANAPYFVCVTVCFDQNRVTSHTIYLRPILDVSLPMPVDSQFERNVAKKIVNWIDNQQTKWSLNKPIYSRSVTDNSPNVLPDFVLQLKENRSVKYKTVIEVMGGRDENYYQRKSKLLPLMTDAWNANSLDQIHELEDLALILGKLK